MRTGLVMLVTTSVAAGMMLSPGVAGATTACSSSLSVVPSQSVGSSNSGLAGVAALSPSNAWAVGHYAIPTIAGPLDQSLVEHWNGSAWSAVASPNVANMYTGDLWGISARSATDIWAVGASGNTYGAEQPLAVHFNGTVWSAMPTPDPSFIGANLYGVAVVPGSPAVWAVGTTLNANSTYQTLIERFDGTSWSIVPSPNVGASYNMLFGVAAISVNNVWAVGTAYAGTSTIPVTARTLVEHWNGSVWTVVSSPNRDTAYGSDSNVLFGVSAVPGTSTLWAVGDSVLDVPPGAQSDQPLVEAWNGTAWQLAPAEPSILPASGGFVGVNAVSPADVWAVGNYNPGSGFDSPLVEHFNGTTWSQMGSVNAGSLSTDVYGVAASPGAVLITGNYETGNFTSPGPTRTFAMEQCPA